MKSTNVSTGGNIAASQYNNLRDDAKGGSFLLAHQQTVPNLTLAVEPGVFYIGNIRVDFASGNSPSFAAPSANPRIDLLTIDSAGSLSIILGSEAANPVPPAYPTNKLAICEVYCRVGQTTVLDSDSAGQGYIYRDVRPFLGGAYIAATGQIADGVITAAKLAQTYIQTTGDETVNGIKTFGAIPVLPATDPTDANQAARKGYIDAIVPKLPISIVRALQSGTNNILGVYDDSGVIVVKAYNTATNNDTTSFSSAVTSGWGDELSMGSWTQNNLGAGEQASVYIRGLVKMGSSWFLSQYNWGSAYLYRDTTNLTNSPGYRGALASDGTYIYIKHDGDQTTIAKCSISGNTVSLVATFNSAVNIKNTGAYFFYYEGSLYAVGWSNNTIYKLSMTGAVQKTYSNVLSGISNLYGICQRNGYLYATAWDSVNNTFKYYKLCAI